MNQWTFTFHWHPARERFWQFDFLDPIIFRVKSVARFWLFRGLIMINQDLPHQFMWRLSFRTCSNMHILAEFREKTLRISEYTGILFPNIGPEDENTHPLRHVLPQWYTVPPLSCSLLLQPSERHSPPNGWDEREPWGEMQRSRNPSVAWPQKGWKWLKVGLVGCVVKSSGPHGPTLWVSQLDSPFTTMIQEAKYRHNQFLSFFFT